MSQRLSSQFAFKQEAPVAPRVTTEGASEDDHADRSSSCDSISSDEDFGQRSEIYEQWREDVFDSNEDNILNDAVYVYDYVN